MQAAYQSVIDEPIDPAPAEPEAMERWDEPEQMPELIEEVRGEDPALNPANLLAAAAQAEQRLAAQVREVIALRSASTEAKRQYGFGSLKAESRRRHAVKFQQHLEDEFQAKCQECNQADVPPLAEGEVVPLPFTGAEQIAVVPTLKPETKADPFDRETHMTRVRQQAATFAAR